MKNRSVTKVFRIISHSIFLGLACASLPCLATSKVHFERAAAGGVHGTGDIGGGAGVVCRDREQNIASVRLLDLYEGEELNGLKIPNADAEVDAQIVAFSRRLGSFTDISVGIRNALIGTEADMQGLALASKESAEYREGNVVFETPLDLGLKRAVPKPNGCNIEAIGYREGNGKMVVSKLLYGKLSQTHQAAFWVHEGLYSLVLARNPELVNRENGTADIRALVAAVFAENSSLEDLAEAFRPIASEIRKDLKFPHLRKNPAKARMIHIPLVAASDTSRLAFVPGLIPWKGFGSADRFEEAYSLVAADQAKVQCFKPEDSMELLSADSFPVRGYPKSAVNSRLTTLKGFESINDLADLKQFYLSKDEKFVVPPKVLAFSPSCLLEKEKVLLFLDRAPGTLVLLYKDEGGQNRFLPLVEMGRIPTVIRLDFLGSRKNGTKRAGYELPEMREKAKYPNPKSFE